MQSRNKKQRPITSLLHSVNFTVYLQTKIIMKIKLTLIVALLIVGISACKKDLAGDWEGTYTGTSGSTISRVIVTKVNANTIRLDLQTNYFGSYITYATVGNGKLISATSLAVDENATLAGSSDIYHFTGAGSLSGNTLLLTGQAKNNSNSSDIKNYAFTGTK